MSKKIASFLVTTGTAFLFTTAVLADEVPAPPRPKPGGGAKSAQSNNDQKQGKSSKGAIAKAAACGIGTVILGMAKPVPLAKMSKRQWRRYRVEMARWQRAQFFHMVGCPIGGIPLSAGLIAMDDFRLRFITKELPIKRTTRQEKHLFWIAGGESRPDFSKPDPDFYGPR